MLFNRVLVGYHTVLKLPTGASLLYLADMGDNYAVFGKEKFCLSVVRRDRDIYVKKTFKTSRIKTSIIMSYVLCSGQKNVVEVGKMYNRSK